MEKASDKTRIFFHFLSKSKQRRMILKKLSSGLMALALFAITLPFAAQAGNGTVAFKPGALKAAIERGETVLLHYKSTW